MKEVILIELGMGVDMHGQDITKAAIRAVENAIYHNSLPGLRNIIEKLGGSEMCVNVRLALPCNYDELDLESVKKVFPYGKITVELSQGGMITSNIHMLADKGDISHEMYIVNAAVEVGY